MRKINIKNISTAFLVFFCILALSASSASYGHISSHGKMVKDVKLLEINNICKAYLQKASFTGQENTLSSNSQDENIRGKSQAMAVGILFGARYALGPRKETAADAKVQAIKDYRNCQKERALKS